MAQEIGYLLVACDKAAERGKRLTESSHDKVHVFRHAEMIADTATSFAKHAYAMSFIDHDTGIVLLGKTHYFGKIGYVALHRKHTVGHNQLYFRGIALLKLCFKRLHVIMLVLECLRE